MPARLRPWVVGTFCSNSPGRAPPFPSRTCCSVMPPSPRELGCSGRAKDTDSAGRLHLQPSGSAEQPGDFRGPERWLPEEPEMADGLRRGDGAQLLARGAVEREQPLDRAPPAVRIAA